MGDDLWRSLGWLELDDGIEEDGGNVELEGGSVSVGVRVGVGSVILGIILVDEGFSDVELGMLDVDGGS